MAYVLLVFVFLVAIGIVQRDSAVVTYNLLVDIVVGVFTVWGLFWAATEFSTQSVKPEIRLILGEEDGRAKETAYWPIDLSEISVTGTAVCEGQSQKGVLRIGLFVENLKPRMAQYLQLAIEVDSLPPVAKVLPRIDSFVYKPFPNRTRNKVVLGFDAGLVVYQGEGVFLGVLEMNWHDLTLPDTCDLRYAIYKAVGHPDTGKHRVHIDWQQLRLPPEQGDDL